MATPENQAGETPPGVAAQQAADQRVAEQSAAASAAAEAQARRGAQGQTVISDDDEGEDGVRARRRSTVERPVMDEENPTRQIPQGVDTGVGDEVVADGAGDGQEPISEDVSGVVNTLGDLSRRELTRLRSALDSALGRTGQEAAKQGIPMARQVALMTRHHDVSDGLSVENAIEALEAEGHKGIRKEDIADVAVRSKRNFRKEPIGQHYVRVVTMGGRKLYATIGTPEDPPTAPEKDAVAV